MKNVFWEYDAVANNIKLQQNFFVRTKVQQSIDLTKELDY